MVGTIPSRVGLLIGAEGIVQMLRRDALGFGGPFSTCAHIELLTSLIVTPSLTHASMQKAPAAKGLTITNPLILYRALLATKRIENDPAQHHLGTHSPITLVDLRAINM